MFEIAKQGGKALPVCVQTEEAFRGHLIMCFMATAAIEMMPDVPAKSRTSLTVESMLGIFYEQHAIECDGQLVNIEPVRKMNEAYRAFGVKCPDTIGLPVVG